jgi:hypothetical protein
MKMNALQHGCDAAPENDAAVMRALGEDPEHYAALKRDLATAYGPGDAFWDRQTEDLARLYWRRNRLERMETGLMRDALEEVEDRRRELARDLADVTFEPSQCQPVALDLPQPTHPLVRLRMLISLWGVIREQVRRRLFSLERKEQIESYYQGELGWRPRQIAHLLGLFWGSADVRKQHDQTKTDKYVKDTFGDEAGREARYQELLRLLEEQIAATEAAFAEEMKAQEQKDAIARDACLAPEGKTWEMLLRQEAGLDRAIDRKVRILLTMRQEHARGRGGSRTAPTELDAGPPADESPGAGADTPSSVCDSGQDGETRPSLRETQTPNGRGLRQPAQDDGTESPIEENAGETSKSPEQSQNVIENKGSAADVVAFTDQIGTRVSGQIDSRPSPGAIVASGVE